MPRAIFPLPRQIRMKSGRIALSSVKRVEVADLFAPGNFAAASYLQGELRSHFGLQTEVGRLSGSAPAILLGMLDCRTMSNRLRSIAPKADLRMLCREGNALLVGRDGAVVAGRDSRGIMHGVQTLLQLVEREDGALIVPRCEILDWPAHPFRGVHLYVPPKREIEHFKRLIRYLALCKINTIILELGGAMELRRRPQINRAWEGLTADVRRYPWGQGEFTNFNPLHGRGKDSVHAEQGGGSWISQEDMRGILQCAREHQIAVVPEVQSLSHSYWLCMAHPEIAEWGGDRYPDTYCPSNPRTYELLFDVLDEVCDVFQPEWLHIGHDELYFYHICPQCRKRPAYELLAGDVNKIAAHLRGRGVKCIMWADKLINPDELQVKSTKEWGTGRQIKYGGGRRELCDDAGSYVMEETWQALDLIPNDVLMCDWYYSFSPDTQDYFARHGKDVIFGNFSPTSFAKYGKRLYAPNVRGGVFSSWIENSRLALAHNNWPLMAAISAEMFWSDSYNRITPQDRMADLRAFWSRRRDLLDAPGERRVSRGTAPCACEPVDLACNSSPAPLPLPDGVPAKLRLQKDAMAVPFSLAPRPRVISLDMGSLTIPIGKRFKAIAFLYGSTIRQDDIKLPPIYDVANYDEYYQSVEVARLVFSAQRAAKSAYGSAKQGATPIRLGMEIGSVFEPYGLSQIARPAFCDGVAAGPAYSLYVYEWRNPNPENLTIRDVTIAPGRSPLQGHILLYGVTLLT
jgi:hypothetical protein